MPDSFFSEANAAVRTVLETGDTVTWLIAFACVLIAALKMDRMRQIVWASLAALGLFAAGGYIYAYLRITPLKDVTDGARLIDQLRYSWNTFTELGLGPLAVYVAAFVAAILALFGVRRLLSRG